MWYIYWFCAAAVLMLWSLRSNRAILRTATKNNGENGTFGRSKWLSLKVAIWMILYPKTPSYELAHHTMQQLCIENAYIDIPMAKGALLLLRKLSTAKQVMTSSHWTDRFPQNYYLFKSTWNKPYGLLFGGGESWRHLRPLTLRILHQLKFFKTDYLERLILREVDEVLHSINQKFKSRNAEAEATFCPHQMFEVHTLNIVSQIGWGERYDESSTVAKELIESFNVTNRSANIGFGPLEVLPWLTQFPSLTFYGDFKKGTDVAVAYFKNLLNERRQKGDYQESPADFTDYFLQEIDKQENPEFINDENYCVTMRDLVWAGTDTTNSTLEHGILQMALNPHIQTAVQAEIDQVVGYSRTPSYADRASMNYTQAVLLEILRYATPVPLTSRSCPADAHIAGESIPKGSLCGINIYSVHRSEELWEDPSEFRPERFLGPQGEIVNADKIIPFGFGKHACIGESASKVFLFIAFVSLMQHYNFRISSKHSPPSLKNSPGISRCPIPYFVTAKRRNILAG